MRWPFIPMLLGLSGCSVAAQDTAACCAENMEMLDENLTDPVLDGSDLTFNAAEALEESADDTIRGIITFEDGAFAMPAPLPKSDDDRLIESMTAALSAPKRRSVGTILYDGLRTFRGKPEQYVFKRIGYPDTKMLVGGTVVYSWINSTSNIDGSTLRCTVKVIVRGGKIVDTDFDGNNGACARYARKFEAVNI